MRVLTIVFLGKKLFYLRNTEIGELEKKAKGLRSHLLTEDHYVREIPFFKG